MNSTQYRAWIIVPDKASYNKDKIFMRFSDYYLNHIMIDSNRSYLVSSFCNYIAENNLQHFFDLNSFSLIEVLSESKDVDKILRNFLRLKSMKKRNLDVDFEDDDEVVFYVLSRVKLNKRIELFEGE